MEYVGYDMASGDLDKFLRYADRMESDLLAVAASIESGSQAYDLRGEALIALPALAASIARVVATLQACRSTVALLSEIGTTLDRAGSGDDGPDTVADEAVLWMRSKLGLPPIDRWHDRQRKAAP